MEGMAAAKASRVAVIGASGYGGLQTLRLLQGHPALSVTFLGGERSAGQRCFTLLTTLALQVRPNVYALTHPTAHCDLCGLCTARPHMPY